jgi:hypothetical protein
MRTIRISARVQGATHGRMTGSVLNPRDLTLTRGRLHSTDAGHTTVHPAPDNEISCVPLGGWPHSEPGQEVGIVRATQHPPTHVLTSGPQARTTRGGLVKLPARWLSSASSEQRHDRSPPFS